MVGFSSRNFNRELGPDPVWVKTSPCLSLGLEEWFLIWGGF